METMDCMEYEKMFVWCHGKPLHRPLICQGPRLYYYRQLIWHHNILQHIFCIFFVFPRSEVCLSQILLKNDLRVGLRSFQKVRSIIAPLLVSLRTYSESDEVVSLIQSVHKCNLVDYFFNYFCACWVVSAFPSTMRTEHLYDLFQIIAQIIV